MFERILVPVDFTEPNYTLVEKLPKLASGHAEVTLLHVIEEIERLDDGEDRDFYRRLTEMAGRKMQRLAKAFEEGGLSVKTEIVVGKRAATIVSCAKERGYDLLALSSHPIDWNDPWKTLGSTSHQVAIAAPCSVFLAK